MAEFKDNRMWVKLSFLLFMLAFTCHLASFTIGSGISTSNGVQGAMICGFIFFLAAAVLIICIIFINELHGSKIALIFFLIFAFIAGLATIIGFVLWGANSNSNSIHTFNTTVGICGALMAILAAIFAIVELVGVKSVRVEVK